jgi:hypothetical protein
MHAMLEWNRKPGDLDLLVQWQARGEGAAHFSAALDNRAGTVRVVGGGLWQRDDVERYLADQRRVVAAARARFGPLKVFFDVRDWVVENEASATQFQDANGQLYLPSDRLAAMVASSLYKPYPRTALRAGNPESFVSRNAAETWLHAYSEGGPAL